MKKRVTKKHHCPIHRAPKQHEAVIVLRRIVVLTACVGLFLFVFAIFNKPAFDKAVAGIAITRGLFVQATVPLPNIPGAAAYNIYYKPTNASDYTNAVRNIPATLTSYTIGDLKKGVAYEYKVSAVNPNGAEYWWSDARVITDLQPM